MPEQVKNDWARRDPNAPQLTELQEEFLEWLVDPAPVSQKGSQNQWAIDHGVNSATPTNWKKTVRFREQWEKRLKEMNVSPERVQTLIDRTWELAEKGDPKMIELYMKIVDRISPPTMKVTVERLEDLSDEDLAARARAHLEVINGGDA